MKSARRVHTHRRRCRPAWPRSPRTAPAERRPRCSHRRGRRPRARSRRAGPPRSEGSRPASSSTAGVGSTSTTRAARRSGGPLSGAGDAGAVHRRPRYGPTSAGAQQGRRQLPSTTVGSLRNTQSGQKAADSGHRAPEGPVPRLTGGHSRPRGGPEPAAETSPGPTRAPVGSYRPGPCRSPTCRRRAGGRTRTGPARFSPGPSGAGSVAPSRSRALCCAATWRTWPRRRYARQSVAQRASALRRYFRWLSRNGTLASDPTAGLSARTGEGRLPGCCREASWRSSWTGRRSGRPRSREQVRLRDDAVLELLVRERLAGERAVRAGHGGRRPDSPLGHGVGQGVQAAEGAHFRERGRQPWTPGSAGAGS